MTRHAPTDIPGSETVTFSPCDGVVGTFIVSGGKVTFRQVPLPPPPNETMTEAQDPTAEVVRDIVRPSHMIGYEGSPWPWANMPWPRVWHWVWRLAAMLAWVGGCWALAELTK